MIHIKLRRAVPVIMYLFVQVQASFTLMYLIYRLYFSTLSLVDRSLLIGGSEGEAE